MSKEVNKNLSRSKNKVKTNRFLDGRQGRLDSNLNNIKTNKKHNKSFLIARLKAFITDLFLINMPILYITTYIILDGRQSFLNNQIAIAICTSCYCTIIFLFLWRLGQTPGFRYAEISLVRIDYDINKNLGFKEILRKLFAANMSDCNKNKEDSNNISNLDTSHSYNTKPKAWQCFIFIVVWLVEISFFLWIICFLRKDKRSLHEILSNTKIVYKQNKVRLSNSR